VLVEREVGHEALQAGILVLDDRSLRSSLTPSGRRPALDLAEGVGDLLLGELGFLHRFSSFHSRTATRRDSLLQTAHVFWGDVKAVVPCHTVPERQDHATADDLTGNQPAELIVRPRLPDERLARDDDAVVGVFLLPDVEGGFADP
jgi:hypothetical protein